MGFGLGLGDRGGGAARPPPATIVGTRSFGRGSVQTIIALGSNGALRLTTARYVVLFEFAQIDNPSKSVPKAPRTLRPIVQ